MSDEWKLGVVYVCPERDIECGSFERNWCANCPKRRATPPSPSTAPTQQDQANVLPPFAAPAGQHDASAGETLDQKAENALLWCYRRLKNSYGRLPFVEEAIAGLRERTAAAGAARQGGGNNSNSPEFDGIKQSITAPTVEVDERAAFQAPQVVLDALDIAYDLAVAEANHVHEVYKGYKPHRHAAVDADVETIKAAQAALASKPPAREAAERQSIDTRDFRIVLDNWAGALHSYDHRTRTVYAKQAYNALIAHIDTWGGAAKGESDGR